MTQRLWQMDSRWMQHMQVRAMREAGISQAGLTPETFDDYMTERIANYLGVDAVPLERTGEGIAILSITGPIYKQRSPFRSNYRSISMALDELLAEVPPAVVIKADSPGGQVDGLQGVVEQVALLAEQTMVVVHAEGMCASAMYRIASQAGSIFATSDSEIGSIGTYWQFLDVSKAFETAGIESVLLSTGPFKGVGAMGEAITDEQRAFLQEITDKTNAFMLSDVEAGRGFDSEQLEKVSDGRFWLAADAMDLSLIDGITTFENVMSSVRNHVNRSSEDMSKEKLTLTDGKTEAVKTPEKAAATEAPKVESVPEVNPKAKPEATVKTGERTLADFMESFGDAEGAKMFRDGSSWEDASQATITALRGQLQDAEAEKGQLKQRVRDLVALNGEEHPVDTPDETSSTVSFSEAARAGGKNKK